MFKRFVYFRLTLNQILEELENEDDGLQRLVYITPPNDGMETDGDSDKSDDEHQGNINNLGRHLLNSICEVQTEYKPNFDIDSNDEPNKIIERRPTISSEHAIENVNPLPSTSNTCVVGTGSTGNRPKRKRKEVDYFSSDDEFTVQENSKAKTKVVRTKKIQPLPKLTKKQTVEQKKSALVNQWTSSKPNFLLNTICDPVPCSDKAMECTDPLDFFTLFFDSELIDYICEQSNLYASQKNVDLNLTRDELLVVMGGMLLSGYAKYPNKRLYWSADDDVPKLLSQSMRCNRFEQIMRFIHLNDNTKIDGSDKLFKLRPYIDVLNRSFRDHGGLDENLAVDESMIPYYGKHYAKQYIRGKPIRFGFKNWALCSSNGYLLAFDIYTGRNPQNVARFGLGGDIVLKLIEKAEVPDNSGHKLYIDNFFTSVPLLKYLSQTGYCATGTIRADRTEYCTLKSTKEMEKEERGSFDFKTTKDVMLVRWNDNSVCTVGTNCEEFSVGTARRWCRTKKSTIQVPQPTVFAQYNKGMGGVDLMDQNIASYRTRMRQRKWWWPIFVYLFDASVSNAWILNRKLLPADKAITQLLKFRRYLAVTLLRNHGLPPSQGKSTPKPLSSVRYDNSNHWPVVNQTERRCANCPGKAKFICSKCNVGLHPKCFMVYHKQ